MTAIHVLIEVIVRYSLLSRQAWCGAGLLALVAATLLAGCGKEAGPPSVESKRLDNGLTILLQPVKDAKEAVLVVLYAIGNDHDPEERSGLAHLTEHVYVTAAAGRQRARSVEDYMKKYPAGWNAQTGERYTVVATVFAREALEDELTDAAARMGELRVTAADLQREKPRLVAEVGNMFGGIPQLAAKNLARERLQPSPRGGRKGGLPNHVDKMTADEVQDYWRHYYKPVNSTLVLVGGFDEASARAAIAKHFGRLPAGEPAPTPASRGSPRGGALEQVPVKALQAGAASEVCLAYSTPSPNDLLYAPFLVLVARLQANASRLGLPADRFPVTYALLDNPEVLQVSAPIGQGETAEKTLARLDAFVAAAVAPALKAADLHATKNMFGWPLGLSDMPDALLVKNLYGEAFALGRRHQLALDPVKLNAALDKLTDADLRQAAISVFSTGQRAAVAISPRQ
jgi:zinc protease